MAVETVTLYVAHCDVCRLACGEDSDHAWIADETEELLLQQVADTPGWTVDGWRIVCPSTDTAHDTARGGPSPVELRPTGDAMAWSPS